MHFMESVFFMVIHRMLYCIGFNGMMLINIWFSCTAVGKILKHASHMFLGTTVGHHWAKLVSLHTK